MSIHMASNRKEVETVSTRVKTTKKEIEVLKAELEKLIHSGTHSNKPTQDSGDTQLKITDTPVIKQAEPASQPQIIPKKNVPPNQKKPEPPETSSPKKTRNYNVVEAREYIKKQREKRAEELKSKINVTGNKLDLKKQKLKELHQKTLELVNKNVQLKRERSKSREKDEPLRLDKANPRQKSLDRFTKKSDDNLGTNFRNKSQERFNNKENVNKARTNFAQQRPKSKSRERAPSQEKVTTNGKIKPGPSGKTAEDVPKDRASRSRTRKIVEIAKPSPLAPIGVTKIDTNLLYPPNINLNQEDNDINLEKTVYPIPQSEESREELNRRITVRQKEVLEHSIMTDACLKDSKETQTSKENNEPFWLQPPPLLPYPYNFINTVKRKLQHAINSPRSYVDVAVQNSQLLDPTPEPKSREEIKEILKSASSEIKSFASHKCPNLDLKVVENLELVPNSKHSNLSKNLFVNYDSESDTSKNIPEISSESMLSSRKDKLSLDRVKKLKLQPHKLTNSGLSSVKTDTNGYPELKNGTYSSDFMKESGSTGKSSGIMSGSSSTIKTITSERKVSDIPLPSDSSISTQKDSNRVSSKSSLSSIATERSGTTTTDKSSSLKDKSIVVTENLLFPRRKNEEVPSFKSLLTEGQISKSTTEDAKTISSTSSSSKIDGLALKEPTISLSYKKGESNADLAKSKMKNITIRPTISTNNNINEIHLKFEAEVRLLNDFNESLRQFMNVEKAFEDLKNKNDATKIMQNVDTQTSVVNKTSTTLEESPTNNQHSSINFSRGSEILEELNDSVLSNNNNNHNLTKSIRNSTFSTEMNFSNLNVSNNSTISMEDKFKLSTSNLENYNVKNCAGLSLNMFEQLIRDEDARIQQLKAIIKIREQALLDRTKGELVWLEIQKKQLIETGKIEEASLLKKKQRGIILKHEQERNEIKKLKQMQKEASEERKNILKQQRNLIKSQLSTKNMLSKIKVKTPKERRSSFGPLRVVQSCSESIHSETSISVRSSMVDDVFSVTSHSVRVSELESEVEVTKEKVSNVKRTLYMREAALQKRRKAAEELLRWHRKLLDEEKKIAELEAAATSVIKRMPKKLEEQLPPPPSSDRYRFNGKQLNHLWKNMTGRDEKKFVEEKVYVMSQLALERLCKSARQSSSNKNRKRNGDASTTTTTEGERRTNSEQLNYSSVFDAAADSSVQEKISSSISELIDNFTRIEDEISLISRKSEQDITSLKETEEEEESSHSSVEETSVLKTMTPNHVSEPDKEIKIDEITTKFEEVSDEIATEDNKEESLRDAISSSPKETVEEVEEIVTEKSPVTESADTKPDAVLSTEEIEEEKITTAEKSPEEQTVTENDDINRDSSVVTEETEQFEEVIVSKEKSSEQIATETKNTQPESSSVVSSEPIELSVEEEEKSSTKPSVEEEKLETITVEKSPETSAKSSKEETTPSVEEEKLETITVEKSSETSAKSSKEETTPSVEEEKLETVTVEKSSAKSSKEEITEKSSEEEESIKSQESEIKSEENETAKSTTPSADSAKENLSLEEALECASKIEESLMKLNKQLTDQKKEEELKVEEDSWKPQEISEEIPTEDVSIHSLQETYTSKVSPKSETKSSSKTSEVIEKTPPKKTSNQIDVKKRVSEILADANAPRGDKSPRLQDLYITAYDVGSSTSPEFIEPFEDGRPMPTDIFGSEAEELWRKQLAIEQEIKQLEQQQKEQIPYVFMREIPNKPPPPYTPPSSQSSLPQSVLPLEVKQINEISDYSSKVLHKAYLNNNLDKVKFSENGFKLFSKVEVTKICAEFVFNICKDIAKDHYKQFEKVEEPSWLMMAKKPQLTKTKPLDAVGLEKLMNNKLKELFGFKKAQVTESAIIKWGRKKRDHVDELLVIESQEEEPQWTNFDMDELIVKDQITKDIMKMLIDDTATVFSKILAKKKIVIG